MTKGVRSLPAARSDPSHLQTSADDTVKNGSALICLIGRLELQKYLSTLAFRSGLFQIAQYCFAGFAQQGQFGKATVREAHMIGIGAAAPPTLPQPPCVRVRTRRFAMIT